MLEETKDLLAKLNKKTQIRAIKRAKRKGLFLYYKKNFFLVVIIIFAGLILFFPIQAGTIVGAWINDFFGTIYKNILK